MILLTTLKNDEKLSEKVAEYRKAAKILGIRIRTYGRMKNRREVFSKTGKRYVVNGGGNSNSIYSIKTKEAPFCYEWKIYRTETKEELELYKKNATLEYEKWLRQYNESKKTK